MFLLPKGKPLFENLATTKLNLPEVVAKLNNGGFTGYASFLFQTCTVILVFETGKLACTLLYEQNGKRQSGFQAMSALAELLVTSGSGTLSVYKLSKDLTMCINALLQGESLYRAQELKFIDMDALLAKIKSDHMSGCLRIYTDEHSAMIFYKEGNQIGLFHDGSSKIEASSTEFQKIAGMSGARIDLFSTLGVEGPMEINLPDVTDIQKIWDTSVALHLSEIEKANENHEKCDKKMVSINISEFEEQIKTIVGEYIGKVSLRIVDKALSDNGGNSCLIDDAGSIKFLAGIERSAKLLVSSTNINLMMERISAVISAAKSTP